MTGLLFTIQKARDNFIASEGVVPNTLLINDEDIYHIRNKINGQQTAMIDGMKIVEADVSKPTPALTHEEL